MSRSHLKGVVKAMFEGNGWEKLANPKARQHGTAWPTSPNLQERYGIRFDYAGTTDGKHRYTIQGNKKADNSTIKEWVNKHGSDAKIAQVEIKEGASKDETREEIDKTFDQISLG